MDSEPKMLVADLLSEVIGYIKQSRPTTTDGSSTQGYVYAQLRPGEMVSPRAHARPWTPNGSAGAPAPGAVPPAGSPAPDSTKLAVKRAMDAAFNNSQLFDTMMLVTDDSTLARYSGGGKRIDVQYGAILGAMECDPAEAPSPEIVARREEARAVLWDAKGNPSEDYQRYMDNQIAYADATAEFTITQNKTLADPELADSWPILARKYQFKVEQALDRWTTNGAEKIEAALATLGSIGVPLEQGMIGNARDLFEAWKVSVSGQPGVETQYTFLMPPEWPEIEVDDIGWTSVTKSSSSYRRHFEQHGYGLSTGEWKGASSSTSGSGGIGICGFGFSGSHSESSSSSSSEYSQTSSDGTVMSDDASELELELQYGLVRIMRPWLVPDLFAMKNWYLKGQKAGVISNGTIAGQVRDEEPLMPVIPTHVLVIRNVRITSKQWGSVRNTLESHWGKQEAAASSSSSSTSGGVSIPIWGPLSLSASASHSSSKYEGDFADESGQNLSDDYGAHFDGETLQIKGAQIVAWLGEILPMCPPLSDPALEDAVDGTGTSVVEPALVPQV